MSQIEKLVELIREYQVLIEKVGSAKPHTFLSACARVLPQLYVAGLNLPDIEPEDDELHDKDTESPLAAIQKILGHYDRYSEVFDPVFDKEAISASLADDLADIYIDLVRPLARYDEGHRTDAVWQWKFNFQHHWGDHLVGAMRVIHRLVNDHMPDDWQAE